MRKRSTEQKHWKIVDTLYKADGTVETMEYHNSITNGLSIYLSALIMGVEGYGTQPYFVFGSGSASWDGGNTPPVDLNSTRLTNEFFRKAVAPEDIKFVNSNDEVVTEVTNRIRMSVRLGEGEGTGAIREFGIMTGTATMTPNSGVLINRKNHGLVTKEASDILERAIILVI